MGLQINASCTQAFWPIILCKKRNHVVPLLSESGSLSHIEFLFTNINFSLGGNLVHHGTTMEVYMASLKLILLLRSQIHLCA